MGITMSFVWMDVGAYQGKMGDSVGIFFVGFMPFDFRLGGWLSCLGLVLYKTPTYLGTVNR